MLSGDAVDAQGPPGASALRIGAALGGVVLVAVAIFGLGVMVGKRVAESVPVVEAPPAALPTETVAPPAAAPLTAATPIAPEKMTFYDRLSGVAPATPVALPDGQAPRQQVSSTAAAAKPSAATPNPAPAGTVATESPAAAAVAAREKFPRLAEPRPAPTPAGTAPQKSTLPPVATAAVKTTAPSREDPAAQIRKLSGKGNFAVQMAAVNERPAAEATAARIKQQGFEVLTVMASVKGKIWYRIRVGQFPSRQAAAQAAGIFRSAYGLNAIAVQD